jgi:DNA-binding HxlR family transcriptional regulator
MKRYGQLCPVAKAAEVFCERWTALIIRDLGGGASRFSELHRGVPLMSRSMLSRRLKELERENIVERAANRAGRGSFYRLTRAGKEFLPAVQALGRWGQRWSRRELSDREPDCRVLLWEMERCVRADAFEEERSVVRVEFSDQPSNKRCWWFLSEAGEVHLCVRDPGYEINLYLATSLRDMVALWHGELPLSAALRTGRLKAYGPSRFTRAVRAWLNLEAFHAPRVQADNARPKP